MFIVSLTYIAPIELIEKHLIAHSEFLKRQYEEDNFILSGRKNPRTGGIIISKLKDKNKLVSILEEGSFKQNNLAEYEIIKVVPTMTSEELKFLRN